MGVPLCSPNEAKEVVQILEQTMSVVDQLDQQFLVQIQKCEMLRQSILQGAFSGQLLTPDPNDEPASMLLERIRAEKKDKVNGKKNN